MRFTTGKKRTPPAVIIVSLIDILIVLLIFLMVTTTFRQQPAVKLVLPESAQAQKTGATEDTVLVTVAKDAPHFYLGERVVTLEELEAELLQLGAVRTNLQVTIRPDEGAAVQLFLQAMDTARAARVRDVTVMARQPGKG